MSQDNFIGVRSVGVRTPRLETAESRNQWEVEICMDGNQSGDSGTDDST